MLDIRYIRQNVKLVQQKLADRGGTFDLASFLTLEERRRFLLQETETRRAQKNSLTRRFAEARKQKEDPASLRAEMAENSLGLEKLEEELAQVEAKLAALVLTIPNLPHESVVSGTDAEDNPVIRVWGEKRTFDFTPRPHWELGEELGILDFARGAKITGARFTLYRGLGARLERALINFMLDIHTREHGYEEIFPPFLVNQDSMTATGQLPKFAQDSFRLEGTDFFLIPTAEVPVTNIHRGEILSEEELPVNYVAYSACFRQEAGSYGKDTRGLIRQHQFNKVELVKFTRPEESYEELERLTRHAEEVLRRLEIPYRVVSLCSGDLGFSAAKTYDLEVWLPSQGVYREISSCSNFEDFQARRGGIRFRRKETGKVELVHTLNGSGLAVGRTLVAILENCQNPDGTVTIPRALWPYLGGEVLAPARGK
jgi:seryl-tRNA synthetase